LINTWNRRQNPTWIDIIRDAPVLVGYLFSLLMSPGAIGVAYMAHLAVQFLIVVLYVLFPFDFIPEAIFGPLGYLDDMLVLFIIVVVWSISFRRTVVQGR
jgi:RING finger protein 170